MSWLKIDRYFDGPDDRPVTGFMPMLCQHCGNAPCEPVCPVYATYHNEEGLNAMLYNRCVGTRYCGNNCSYKVRRFNWFKYDWQEPLNMQLNPDVTVREVGIMEKCSFCVQRIREAQGVAKDHGRPVRDGEVQPACSQSCPTQAIKFGNLLDKESAVFADSQNARAYKVLDSQINTQPAISYLAKIDNDSKGNA
jgi:molybdopterin-containing oxidoreductase family iron-sulfur binding subunit